VEKKGKIKKGGNRSAVGGRDQYGRMIKGEEKKPRAAQKGSTSSRTRGGLDSLLGGTEGVVKSEMVCKKKGLPR